MNNRMASASLWSPFPGIKVEFRHRPLLHKMPRGDFRQRALSVFLCSSAQVGLNAEKYDRQSVMPIVLRRYLLIFFIAFPLTPLAE